MLVSGSVGYSDIRDVELLKSSEFLRSSNRGVTALSRHAITEISDPDP